MKNCSKFLVLASVLFIFQTNSFARFESYFSALEREPFVRVGLDLNATSVSISTTDTSLSLINDVTSSLYLGTTSLRLTSRAYDPPKFEIYRFEIPNLISKEAAEQLAAKIRQENSENALVMNRRCGKHVENSNRR